MAATGRATCCVLTRREREVLALVAEGRTNVGTARRL
ncbi:MAG: LuxR C-terminal-related transcriptional regulator [Pseudonocardiaceae bacterium]